MQCRSKLFSLNGSPQTKSSFRLPIAYIFFFFTACKRSLGQGNIFRSVCQEFCSQSESTWAVYWTRFPPGPGNHPGPGTPPRTRYTPGTRYPTPLEPGTPPHWDQVYPLPGPGTPPGPGSPP